MNIKKAAENFLRKQKLLKKPDSQYNSINSLTKE